MPIDARVSEDLKKNLQRDRYLDSGGNKCPICSSKNIMCLENVQVDSDSAWQEVECHDCGGLWRDIYRLIDVEIIE